MPIAFVAITGVLSKQVPVIVAYVSAFYVKRHHGNLCDCNVNRCGQTNGVPNDLCNFGAQYIKQDLAAITNVYKLYAQGYAGCYGTTRPIVFEMEPDWYQYSGNTQSTPLTKQEAGSKATALPARRPAMMRIGIW